MKRNVVTQSHIKIPNDVLDSPNSKDEHAADVVQRASRISDLIPSYHEVRSEVREATCHIRKAAGPHAIAQDPQSRNIDILRGATTGTASS